MTQLIHEIDLPEDYEVEYPAEEQDALKECIKNYGARWMAREVKRLCSVEVSDTTIRNYQGPAARGKKNKIDAVRDLVRAIKLKTAVK